MLAQTIPRTLWLDKGKKQLLQWPIEELNTLRGQKIQVRNQELKIGEHVEITGITAAQVCLPSLLFEAQEILALLLLGEVHFWKIDCS